MVGVKMAATLRGDGLLWPERFSNIEWWDQSTHAVRVREERITIKEYLPISTFISASISTSISTFISVSTSISTSISTPISTPTSTPFSRRPE